MQKGFDLLLCGVNDQVIHEGNGCHAVPFGALQWESLRIDWIKLTDVREKVVGMSVAAKKSIRRR